MGKVIKVKHRELGPLKLFCEYSCRQLMMDVFGEADGYCKKCGKPFLKSRFNVHNKEFCSQRCSGIYNGRTNEYGDYVCEFCGKTFEKIHWNKIYCSAECQGADYYLRKKREAEKEKK